MNFTVIISRLLILFFLLHTISSCSSDKLTRIEEIPEIFHGEWLRNKETGNDLERRYKIDYSAIIERYEYEPSQYDSIERVVLKIYKLNEKIIYLYTDTSKFLERIKLEDNNRDGFLYISIENIIAFENGTPSWDIEQKGGYFEVK